ncbi:hypothetical protein [Aliamphritea ceti]|uniref:hypothetical protein n=1 Tax=Aliamphritea ceti TaxID=1524258 RepID=UPI0021C44243|nr:hypothetical protein [Aliamphritea ceti]
MNLNHFNPSTREFTHSAPAISNPVKKGEFFPQAFATAEPLPELKANQIAIRNADDTEWLAVDDYRGTAWRTDTKEPITITELGPLTDGVTIIEPLAFSLWQSNSWKVDRTAELADSKSKAIKMVQAFATGCRQNIAGYADHYTTAGWADKARRAERVVAGGGTAADIKILTAEATRRNKNETPEELAELQCQKAEAYAEAEGVIDGLESNAVNQLNQVTDITAVQPLLGVLQATAETEFEALRHG